MKPGDRVRVKVGRGPFRAGDVGEFRFEYGGRLYIGGLFLGEMDYTPEEVEPAGEDVKPGADASRWAVVLSARRVIKGSTMRHAQVLVADLVDLTLSEPLPTPRRVIEARTAASAREVVAMAAKIAGQHPAFSIDEWHDVTRRALRKTAGVLAEQSQ